jgi:hypothetical protein
MDASERQALVQEVVAELERRGVPEGRWMVDLAVGREALNRLDTILRDLTRAIVDKAEGDVLDAG